MKTAAKIIVSIVLVAVIVLGVLFVRKYTNGFTGEFKTFYVQVNDKDVLSNNETVDVFFNLKTKVNVRYTFDKDMTGYSVKVVPNVEEDFTFIKDGRGTKWSEIDDLTKAVTVTKGDTYFNVTFTTDLQGMLQTLYPTAEFTDVPVALDSGKAYVTLIVYSADKKQSVEINVRFSNIGITKINIDKDGIIF